MAKSTMMKIKLRRSGVFKRTKIAGGAKQWTKVAPRIQLRASGTQLADDSFIAEFRFRDMRGAVRSVFADWSITLPEKKRELKSKLATAGYEWPRDKLTSDAIWAALVDTRPKRKFNFARAPGWYGHGFALPGKFYSADKSVPRVIIDPESVEHVGAFIIGEGSLSDWQASVGKPARKSSPLCLSISAALAAPLLRKLNMDSFAINWFGNTTEGKTLTLKVAASVAGLFGPGGSMPSWADSEAGFEGQAMGHRDCVLPLDETGDGEQKMPLAERARMLAFGIARNRPRTLSASYEKQHGLGKREYRIIVLSSSERALGDVARKAGTPRLGGEEVRFMDIPASEPGSQGIFDRKINPDNGKSLTDVTKALAEKIAAAAQLYQGHVFRAFLDRLMKDNNWEAQVLGYKADFEKKVKVPDAKAVYRIRSNFAVIWAAAALAIDYKILPWKKRRAFAAIKKCFRRCLAALVEPSPIESLESQTSNSANVLQTLKEKLDRCELRPIQQRKKVSDDEAAARQKADGFIIDGVPYVKNDRFEEWFPSSHDRSTLREAGIFRTQRQDTPTIDRKISGIKGKPRYYAIDVDMLEEKSTTK
jgi:hypothetical protein